MLDRKSTKKPIGHIKKHLSLTINSTSEVKDEAYVQVLKQIIENPDEVKTKRGWDFFAILASSYAPSNILFYSILNMLLFEIKHNLDHNIVQRANYIFVRLVKSFENPRKYIPSEKEINHIEVKNLSNIIKIKIIYYILNYTLPYIFIVTI